MLSRMVRRGRALLARARLVAPRHGRSTFAGAYARARLPDAVEGELKAVSAELEPYAALSRGWHVHGSGFVPRYARYVRTLIGLGEVGSGSALDLACGTGITAASLAPLFGRVQALDVSPHMLREARRRLGELPNVELIEADFRSFSLEDPVDLVVSSGDSLNYVRSADELNRVFERVAEALRPGGLFLFDLQSEESFRWCSSVIVRHRTVDVEWLQVHAYDPATRVDDAQAVTVQGVESHRRVYLSPKDVERAGRLAGMRVFESFETPILRWLGARSPRDFYAYRHPT